MHTLSLFLSLSVSLFITPHVYVCPPISPSDSCTVSCWPHTACAVLLLVYCADGVLHCDTLQGLILEALSGVNKVVVGPVVHVAEYDPIVKPQSVTCTDVPECASMSLAVGNRFTVMQVGTVGVAGLIDAESHMG